ncbi:MAG: thioredoxin C-2 [Marine Group I thaumarchaeote]|nr:MAG: thioredoxin C-2 [Marine Group I thaumarchaeote]
MKNITKENWDQGVINSDKPVLVDFFATWCGPCSVVAPILDELDKEYEGKVNFVKVDVDQNKKLASKYNIISIPTIAIFRNGKIVAQEVGTASKKTIKYYIDKNITEEVSA